jgi:hypothetical protein
LLEAWKEKQRERRLNGARRELADSVHWLKEWSFGRSPSQVEDMEERCYRAIRTFEALGGNALREIAYGFDYLVAAAMPDEFERVQTQESGWKWVTRRRETPFEEPEIESIRIYEASENRVQQESDGLPADKGWHSLRVKTPWVETGKPSPPMVRCGCGAVEVHVKMREGAVAYVDVAMRCGECGGGIGVLPENATASAET